MYHNQRHDIFELAIFTTLGQLVVNKYSKLLCLDSTHRTNSYNYNLFTLVAQNEFGQGIPVAFLISSDGKTETVTRFLAAFKSICPSVGTFMTDNDDAEINAIQMVFPESNHLLCWWHVLKASCSGRSRLHFSNLQIISRKSTLRSFKFHLLNLQIILKLIGTK